MIFILIFLSSFNNEFQNFINSPRSESIFVSLMRDKTKLMEYKNDPIILWFWRSKTNDTKVDSFLKDIPIYRNFYLSGVLRWEAKEANDLKVQYNKLRLATHFDSLSIENFLSFISLGITNRKVDLLKTAFSLPIFSDFRNKIFLLGNFAILFILTLFFVTIIFVLIKLIYYLPVLSHRLDPLKHNIFKGIIGFALLLIPILVLRNFYLTLIIYSIILTFIFNNREKNWLRINLILIVIFSCAISMFNFIPFLKGNDRVYYMYQMVALDSDIRINPETRFEKDVLAYALKKQGSYDEAMALYEDLYYNQNIHSVDVLNNLANLYAFYEEDERAEELYRKAMYSDRGEPYFNLALLKFKNIEYLAAGEIMEEARKRGFVSVSKEPVDIVPNTNDFYNLLVTKNLNNSDFIKIKYLLVVLAIFFITFVPFKISPPYYCSICGRAVCKECIGETGEEFYCRECQNKLNATKNEEIEEELKIALGKTKRLSRNIFAIVLNIILPGAGLIYKNRNFLGLVVSFFAIMVYTPILFKSYFIKPSGWVCFSLNPILFLIAVIDLLLCYLTSFSLLFGGSHAD